MTQLTTDPFAGAKGIGILVRNAFMLSIQFATPCPPAMIGMHRLGWYRAPAVSGGPPLNLWV